MSFKFADRNETRVNEIISQDNEGRYHFQIDLPTLRAIHCGHFLIIRYGNGKELFGVHSTNVVVTGNLLGFFQTLILIHDNRVAFSKRKFGING